MTRRKPAHDLDAFHAHLDALKLSFVREHYADVVRSAAEEQRDHLSVLERLIEGEANLRRDRSIQRRIRLARFPVKKTLDSFDWSWCCFSVCLVESPGEFAGLFRRRIAWDDGAIWEAVGVGAGVFVMNRCCRSGEDVGARAASVGKGWASAQHLSMPCPHAP